MSNLSLKFICSHSLEQLTSRFVVPAVGSVTKEENDLRLRADFEPLPLDGVLPESMRGGVEAPGRWRLLPDADHDGFTVHALRRRA